MIAITAPFAWADD